MVNKCLSSENKGKNELSVRENLYFHIIQALIDYVHFYLRALRGAHINGDLAKHNRPRRTKLLFIPVFWVQMASFELVTLAFPPNLGSNIPPY